MKFEPTTVKGFQDFLPPESLKRAKIVEIIEENFKLYGFQPIETPFIEFDELMRSDLEEDEAVSDRFRLKDRGGRNLGLRYEFTFQLARILKENPNLKFPFKRYQIGPVFRDEPTSASRFRQFTQCDIDIIGNKNLDSDAECLACFFDILKSLKIETKIKVNNRKLMNSILDSIQVKDQNAVMREIDKIDKIGEDTVKANLRKYADTNQILTLFKLLEKPLDFFTKNLFEGAEELEKLQKLCKNYGIKIQFSPFMVRGLSYYTGNVFEIISQNSTIAAGGRYDKTVGKYSGKDIPAVGISFGLERLSSLADIQTESTKAILISLDQKKETIKLARKLRKARISCITFFKKPAKALDYANSLRIKYAVFIGQEEVKNKKFKLKDLDSGEEKELTEKQITNKLKK